MIRFSNLILSIFICVFSCLGQSENYFSSENTLKYANYLFNNFDYELAMNEYSQLLSEDNAVLKKYLISASKSKNYSTGISSYKSLIHNEYNQEVFEEYLKLLYLNRNFDTLNKELSNCDSQISMKLKLSLNILDGSLIQSDKLEGFPKLESALLYRNTYNKKNPILAGLASSFLPGSGKFYTGYKKDGIISFLFVGLNSYLSYRGFKKRGLKSGFGWVYSIAGLSFYLGNIHGSYKSAKTRNKKLQTDLNEKLDNIFN